MHSVRFDAIVRPTMLRTTLPLLRCPAARAGKPACAGSLSLAGKETASAGDILFGTLACEACESTFPILAGVAILVSEVEQYIEIHVKGIAALVEESEIPIAYLDAFLQARAGIQTGFAEEDLESKRINALYFMNHFLRAKKARSRGGGPGAAPTAPKSTA